MRTKSINRKVLTAAFLFFFTIGAAHTAPFDISWHIGHLGWAMDAGPNAYRQAFTASALHVLFEHPATGVSFEANPFKYQYDTNENHTMSFANVNVFWNPFQNKGILRNSFLGPFVAVNWLNLHNFDDFRLDDPVVSAGLRLSLRRVYTSYSLFFVDTEIGWQNNAGKNCFYLGIKADAAALVALASAFFTVIAYDEAKQNAENRGLIPPKSEPPYFEGRSR
jgi:hypothetical protein